MAVVTEAMEVPTALGGHGRLCGAKLKQAREDGRTTCIRPAGAGTDHLGVGTCDLHLGATRNHQLAAQRTLAAEEVTRLGLVVATSPTAALSDALNRSYGDVLVTAAKVQLLDGDGWKQRDAAGKFERPSVWLELYWQALDRYARIADRCTALGIEAAAVSVVQRQGAEVVQLLRQVLSALGLDPAAPEVVEVVTRELRVLDGGES